MAAPHRVVALIEARRLDVATQGLCKLGVRPTDLRVEPLSAPPRAPVPASRAPRLVARTAGAVPGAMAAVAIGMGSELALLPVVLLAFAGATVGAVAAVGRAPTRKGDRGVGGDRVAQQRRDGHLRIEARCDAPRVSAVRDLLTAHGGRLLDPGSRTAARREPQGVVEAVPTPPEGLVQRPRTP